jgi:hypothetical protein
MKKAWTVYLGGICAAFLLVAVPLQAAVQENDTTTVGITTFVPCAAGGAGEVVDLVGPLHTLISATINNNNFSGYFHFQPQGISGFGETTGTKYHATGVTLQTFKGSFTNGQSNQTYVNNFRIIGGGPGNNYLVHETLHLTINAKGIITVFLDNFTVDCK